MPVGAAAGDVVKPFKCDSLRRMDMSAFVVAVCGPTFAFFLIRTWKLLRRYPYRMNDLEAMRRRLDW